MQTIDAIYARRSVRKYQNTMPSDEQITTILQAACMAPSATNLQPWYFVAVRSNEKKAELLSFMEGVSEKMRPMLEKRFKDYPEVIKETLTFMKSLGDAPVYVLVFEQKNYEHKNFAVLQSISAATQNLTIAAADLGLGTCWMTAPIQTGFGKIIAQKYAPDKGEMIAMLTLGYPATQPKAPKRKDDRFVII